MGQVLHGSATTTEAIRRAIQHSQASLRVLARRHGINPKTVAKWKKRTSTADLPTGPKGGEVDGADGGARPRSSRIKSGTPSAAIPCCRWTTASTPCSRRSQLSPARRCTAAYSGMAYPGCPASRASRSPRRSSRPTRLASSTSRSPRCAQRKASSTSSWPSTARPSSPLWSYTRRPPREFQATSSATWSRQSPTRCIRAHRQRPALGPVPMGHPFHHAGRRRLGRTRHQGGDGGRRTVPRPLLRTRLRPARHRAPPDQANAPVDRRLGRTHEPHPQGRDLARKADPNRKHKSLDLELAGSDLERLRHEVEECYTYHRAGRQAGDQPYPDAQMQGEYAAY